MKVKTHTVLAISGQFIIFAISLLSALFVELLWLKVLLLISCLVSLLLGLDRIRKSLEIAHFKEHQDSVNKQHGERIESLEQEKSFVEGTTLHLHR